MRVVLGLDEGAVRAQFLNHGLASFHAIHAVEVFARLFGHGAIGANDNRERPGRAARPIS